jgi:hypothetical protein
VNEYSPYLYYYFSFKEKIKMSNYNPYENDGSPENVMGNSLEKKYK